ncbi:MAG TPA: hypothetical protein VK846_07570 [Candidatus Limnocylindria bacterium]|nr:hypothetical protein [Candidatus Limnocylindria bacterium]
MGLLLVILLTGFVLVAVFILPAFHYWRQLGDGEFTREDWRLFVRWVWTGNLVPLVLWIFFNTGLVTPPVWPTVAPMSAGFSVWWKSFEENAGAGAFLISSYWAGITFAWLLWRISDAVSNRRHFLILCGTWSLLLVPLALLVIGIGSFAALGLALMAWFVPLVHNTLSLKDEKPPLPSYSRALARISFGKYDEAERAVIAELEQFEDDFDGWMMLAELYATHFNDLPSADATVRDVCEQPSTTPSQISIALHRLADWHLKIGHDPVRAREVLEQIGARMPGTHLDKMARQRLQQVPATHAEWLEREQGKPLLLPHASEDASAGGMKLPPEQAKAAAEECVRLLQKNPDDAIAREKFARLLAESLDEPRTGIEQLELLLTMPDQSRNKRAEWLLSAGQWHARLLKDVEAAKRKYEEVVRDFRDTPHAFAAQQQINLIELQARFPRRSTAAA